MHPVPTSRLAFSLAARTSESSFPERHAEPDDMAHLHDHEPSYDHHHQPHHEPGFPKLGLLPPGMSTFWQESWLEQYHPPQHHDAPARHRQHHAQNHHWVDDTACFSPTSPADVMRIPSPQTHNTHHPVFSPSPMAPSAAPTDEVTTPSEWDALLHAAHLDFPWLPAHQQQQPSSSKFKSEDDSDSAWSGNDSNSNNGATSSEEIPTPPPQPTAPRRPSAVPPRRRRLGSVPRVTKPSKVPAGGGGGGVYHTFRMSKRPPAPAARPAVVDLIETTPFGPHPITNFGAASAAAVGDSNDPAKMLEKRLAHKLSEKGRRNRLTSAIREIQRLMPLDAVAAVEGVAEGGKGGGEVVYPHFSKVDVVEMAIGYIRRLQRENEEMVRRVKAGEGPPDGGGGEGMGS